MLSTYYYQYLYNLQLMLTTKIAILLLILTPATTVSQFASCMWKNILDFLNFQFSSPNLTPSSSPIYVSQSYPTGYDQSYQYALALAGFNFVSKQIIYFDVHIHDKTSSSYNITFATMVDVACSALRYYLLIASPLTSHFSLTTNSTSLLNIVVDVNMRNFYGPLFETVNVSTPLDITNTSEFFFFPLLVSYRAMSQTDQNIKVELLITTQYPPNTVEMKIERNSINRKIFWVRYTMVVIHQQYLKDQNIFYKTDMIGLYTSPPSGTDYMLDNTLPNFGIPSFFVSANNDYQGVCFIAFTHLNTGSDNSQYYQRKMVFSTYTSPITNNTILPDINYNGSVHRELFNCNYRMFCMKECPAGTYFNSGGYVCSACPGNCPTCIGLNNCTSCATGYILASSFCLSCSTVIPNCVSCITSTNPYSCISCNTGYFVTPSQTSCTTCQDAIPGCLTCTNISYCLTCANSSVFFQIGVSQCVLCQYGWDQCIECSNSQCTVCESGFYPTSQGCTCIVGELVSGVCTEVVGCIAASNLAGDVVCTSCDQTYYSPFPVNGICQCRNGTIVNGICNTNSNCLAPQMMTNGSIICLFCDVMNNFVGQPDYSGECSCKDKYQLNGNICQDICGDGFLMSSSAGACDDGNKLGGDGCSETCQVETYFRCYNGSASSASQCVYEGIPLELTVDSVTHSDGLNQGVLTFAVSPALLTIKDMNLSQLYSLSCDSVYSVSEVSYDSAKGTLSLTVDYSEDLEDRSCNLSLSLDPSLVRSQASRLSFVVQSDDLPLIVVNNLSAYSTFTFIFEILSYIVLAVFCLSFGHKLIGVELLVCCQMAFLSLCLYPEKNLSMLFSSIKSFGQVTGGWQLLSQSSNSQLLPPLTDRTGASPYFLQNCLIPTAFLFVSAILFLFFFLYRHLTWATTIRRKHSKIVPCVDKIVLFNYRWIIFSLSAGFSLPLLLSGYLNNFFIKTTRQGDFPIITDSLGMFVCWLIVAVSFTIEFRGHNAKDEMDFAEEKKVSWWYIPFFMIKILLVLIVFQMGIVYSQKLTTFVLVVVEIIFFSMVTLLRPYSSILHTIGSLVCSSVSLYALILAMLNQFTTFKEQFQIFLIFILEGLIILSLLMTITRLLLQLRLFIAPKPAPTLDLELPMKLSQNIIVSGQNDRYFQKPRQSRHSKMRHFDNYIKNERKVKEEKNDIDEELQGIQRRLRQNFLEYKQERHLPFS